MRDIAIVRTVTSYTSDANFQGDPEEGGKKLVELLSLDYKIISSVSVTCSTFAGVEYVLVKD
jgi:hypothetical protein